MKCVPGDPIDNHPALVYCTFKSNIVCLIIHEVPLCRIHFYNLKSDDTEAIQSYLVLQIIWIKISNLTGRWLLLTTSASHVHPNRVLGTHNDVIKWKHSPRYWLFVRGIHRSPVNSPPHEGQWRGALMFSLIYVWINGWVNNREAGDLRRYRAHYDVTVMNVITIGRISIKWAIG